MRRPVDTVTIMIPVMTRMMYFPRTGINAIHTADIRIRLKSFAGSEFLSAHFPPTTLPRAMAIMMVPMMMVHTIWDDEK